MNINWNNIPGQYNWVASNANGGTFAYDTKPEAGIHQWVPTGKQTFVLDDNDWNQTLTQRPFDSFEKGQVFVSADGKRRIRIENVGGQLPNSMITFSTNNVIGSLTKTQLEGFRKWLQELGAERVIDPEPDHIGYPAIVGLILEKLAHSYPVCRLTVSNKLLLLTTRNNEIYDVSKLTETNTGFEWLRNDPLVNELLNLLATV